MTTTSVETNLKDSTYDFLRVVWPVVSEACGGGQIMPVESLTPGYFEKMLDTHAGIDLWQVFNREGMQGIASRVQWAPPTWTNDWPYNTFSVRAILPSGAATEKQKRTKALLNGWLLPRYTVQAYVSQRRTGMLESAAVVDTAALYRYLIRRDDQGQRNQRTNRYDDTIFDVISWRELEDEPAFWRWDLA